MPVETTRREYDEHLPHWQQVADFINERVKSKGAKYLPKPNKTDTSVENDERYADYKTRALLVNVTKRTHDALLGAVYRIPPTVELPAQLDYLEDNANGTGLGLTQLSRRIVSSGMQSGRAGILVDYPPAPDDLTAEQTRGLQATLIEYSSQQIINWREDGGQVTLVVLLETYEETEDGFEYETKEQYRELRLTDEGYKQRLWREGAIVAEYEPRRADGSRWDVIPFVFVGTVNNDTILDPSMLFALSEVNIAHYRNSADLEENSFVHSQLTLGVVSEMDSKEFQQANPAGIKVGSRAGHFLGKGGNFVSVQAQPNQLADTLMARKEQQMMAIGARLIEQSGGNETAEAVRARTGADSANLSSLAHNVSSGMVQALEYAAQFMGAGEQEIVFELNQRFYPESMDAQTITALIQLYDRGRIGAIDLHRKLQGSGIVADARTVEEIEDEAEQRPPTAVSSFPTFGG